MASGEQPQTSPSFEDFAFLFEQESFEQRVAISRLTDLGKGAYAYIVYDYVDPLLSFDLEAIQADILRKRSQRRLRSEDGGKKEKADKKPTEYRTPAEQELDAGMQTAMDREGYGSDQEQSQRFRRLANVIKGASVSLLRKDDDQIGAADEQSSIPVTVQQRQEQDKKRLREKGSCVSLGDLMFLSSDADINRARKTCLGCGVMDLCGVVSLVEVKAEGVWAALSEPMRDSVIKDLGGRVALREAVGSSSYSRTREELMEAFLTYAEKIPEELRVQDYEMRKAAAKNTGQSFEKDTELEDGASYYRTNYSNLKSLVASIRRAFEEQGIKLPPPLKRRTNKPKEQAAKKQVA